MPATVNYTPDGRPDGTPTYLFDQAKLYSKDPLLAARQWFASAHLGLAAHFGLFSLLGTHEDARRRENWSYRDYNRLPERFQCQNFSASAIVELAIASGARYICLPARWRDGFCLFGSAHSDFNSVKASANRDLVGEIASWCEYHGLGLCLEYSCGHDWQRQAPGLPREEKDLLEYKEYICSQLHELLTQYGPVAAIRLDGLEEILAAGRDGREGLGCQDLYDLIHTLQPPCLISFGKGALGNEDFFHFEEALPAEGTAELGFAAHYPGRARELRLSLTPGGLGFQAEQAGKHRRQPELWDHLQRVAARNGNLLLNTALLPDGSLDLEDIQTLLEFGQTIEKNGLPPKPYS